MKPGIKNSYNSLSDLKVQGKNYKFYSLNKAEENGLDGIKKLPKSLKVLLENLLRYEDDSSVTKNQINAIKNWLKEKKSKTEIAYRPARVLLQDYTGIPAVADLAAMREAVKEKKRDPNTTWEIASNQINENYVGNLLMTAFLNVKQYRTFSFGGGLNRPPSDLKGDARRGLDFDSHNGRHGLFAEIQVMPIRILRPAQIAFRWRRKRNPGVTQGLR